MKPIKHIHEVIFLIENHKEEMTPETLERAISNIWGEEVHFGACSGTAFPKEQALHFLIERKKVVLTEDGKIALHPSMHICNGHEEFEG